MKKFLMTCIFAFVIVPVFFAQSRGLTVKASDGAVLTSFSGSYALVIGESSYYKNTGNKQSWQSLPGVKEDVKEIKKLFEEQGFSVTLLEDKTSKELKNEIEEFFRSYGYDSDSRLIVYYAGHGQTLKKERTKTRDMGYIVPIDCPPDAQDEKGFMQLAIPMDQFDSWAKSIRSRHVLFLFDSCFSGTIFTASRAAPGIIDKSISQPVRQFITSGSEDETVPDVSNFRRELVRALRDRMADYNNDGYVSGSELGQYIQNEVTDSVQSPQYGKINNRDLNRGDFIFPVGARQQADPTDVPRQQIDLASITQELELGSISIASGALRINTATAGHLSILINNKNQDIGDLPGNATLPIPKISAGDLEILMVYKDGFTEKKTVTLARDQTMEVNFNYRPSPVPSPDEQSTTVNPVPIVDKPYFSTGQKVGAGFLNLALGLGSFTMGDPGGGALILGGYVASAGLILTEIYLMEDGVVGTIGLGVAGVTAILGFIRPYLFDNKLVEKNSAAIQPLSGINAGIVPDRRGRPAFLLSYTHSF